MSFYRTYRPQVIEEIDNASVRERLTSLLTKDKKQLPHAYLFSGPRGAGKTTAARVIAKMFNCTKPTKTGPCGKCDECITISEGRNLDVLEIDAASNRGIDEIRALREAIGLSPASAEFKVYIIDEVHMLTTEAFNALLKTLEEPPAHAVFVLATTDPQKVPATIKSRCIAMNFGKATTEELMHALKRIVKAEKLPIEDGALALIAQSVDGSFRDGVKFLEQVSFHKGKISEDVVNNALSLTVEKTVTEFIEIMLKKDAKNALGFIQQLNEQGADMRVFLVSCLKELHKRLIDKVKSGDMELTELKDAIEKLTCSYSEMRTSPIPSLPLELAVVEFAEQSNSGLQSALEPKRELKFATTKTDSETVARNIPQSSAGSSTPLGLLTLDKLTEHWRDVIEAMKPYNHSVAGVLRSARPASVKDGIVTIEAFYKFHQEKLSENKTREELANMLKKLFGEKVKIEVTLGKK